MSGSQHSPRQAPASSPRRVWCEPGGESLSGQVETEAWAVAAVGDRVVEERGHLGAVALPPLGWIAARQPGDATVELGFGAVVDGPVPVDEVEREPHQGQR